MLSGVRKYVASNAPGERRPTGTELRMGTEPALWAVRSTGLLGAGVSPTRRFPARLFPPGGLASPHALPSATTLLHPSRRGLLGCRPGRPIALPWACQRCWPLSLASSSSRLLTWLSRVVILLFSAPT